MQVRRRHVFPRLDNVEEETRITEAPISELVLAVDEEEPVTAMDEEVHPPSPIGALDDTGLIPVSSPGPIQGR